MLVSRVRPALAVAAVLLMTAGVAADESRQTIPAFQDLYEIFPRGEGADTIGGTLATVMGSAAGDSGAVAPGGPLVVVNEYGIFVYDGTTRERLAAVETRDNPADGQFEMTAVSHVGPAIAYLAAIKEAGSESWKPLATDLRDLVDAARVANSTKTDGETWIASVEAASWQPHADQIVALLDYGLWMASDYLGKVLDNDDADFTQAAVGEQFYKAGDPDYPIPFNNVMIGTFALVTLNSTEQLRSMVTDAGDAIDWPNAKVLVHMPIGTNYGAGLTLGTNQLAAALLTVTDGALPAANVLIAPYANAPCTKATAIGFSCPAETFSAETLDQASFDFYATQAWLGIYNRTRIAASAFPGVGTIEIPTPPALPGDWGQTEADDIDGFIQRLKLSLIDDRQLLSNAIGFWIPGALAAAGWDASKVEIPGLTTGFPDGVTDYPSVGSTQ